MAILQVLEKGVEAYDAVFIPGGHGIAFDGTSDELRALVERFWAADKVVAGG